MLSSSDFRNRLVSDLSLRTIGLWHFPGLHESCLQSETLPILSLAQYLVFDLLEKYIIRDVFILVTTHRNCMFNAKRKKFNVTRNLTRISHVGLTLSNKRRSTNGWFRCLVVWDGIKIERDVVLFTRCSKGYSRLILVDTKSRVHKNMTLFWTAVS